MRKLVLGGAAAALALSLTACGGGDSGTDKTHGTTDKQDVTLTFSTNVVGEQATALEEVIKEFTNQTGIKVDFSAPGDSYEDLMKTKMAAN